MNTFAQPEDPIQSLQDINAAPCFVFCALSVVAMERLSFSRPGPNNKQLPVVVETNKAHRAKSEGYASRLKEYPYKGVCGLPEQRETARACNFKVKRQTASRIHPRIKESCHLDRSWNQHEFGYSRFSRTEWDLDARTRETKDVQEENNNKTSEGNIDSDGISSNSLSSNNNKKRPRNPVVMDFAAAKPTLTHKAITRLVEKEHVQFCVTQNVDGLHRRSGLSRAKHAVLHGCVFTETCEDCHMDHFRDTDVGGMSFQKTGRICELCQGDLRDTLLDWEDELPEEDYQRATEECEKADLVICLGCAAVVPLDLSDGIPAQESVFHHLLEDSYLRDLLASFTDTIISNPVKCSRVHQTLLH